MAFGVPGSVRVEAGPRESFEAPVIRYNPRGVFLRATRPLPLDASVRLTVSDPYGLMFSATARVVASSPTTLGLALLDSTPEPVFRAFSEWTVGQMRGAPLTPSSIPGGLDGQRPSAPPPGYRPSAPPAAPAHYSSVPPPPPGLIPTDSLPPLPGVAPILSRPPPPPPEAAPRTVSQAFDAQFSTDAIAAGDPRSAKEIEESAAIGPSLIDDLEL